MLDLPDFNNDRDLRDIYGCFPSGVTAVCAFKDEAPVGMTASAFVPVSLDPPLVSVCVRKESLTWQILRTTPRLGVSFLSNEHQFVARQLADKRPDRFRDIQWEMTSGRAVLVCGATAWLDCSLHDELEAGDHQIALLYVHSARQHLDTSPLIFHSSRFHCLQNSSAADSDRIRTIEIGSQSMPDRD